jgi:Abortive infection C-terminus
MAALLTDEVAAALAKFYHGGDGPSHSALTASFVHAGYSDADPYDSALGTPNKEQRVLAVTRAAMRRPANARKLVEHLLVSIRVGGYLQNRGGEFASKVRALQIALRRAGWQLSDDAVLSPLGVIDLTTGGRPALDEQIDRLRRSTDDAGALLGSAKDMLEATAKFVLEELGLEVSKKADFNYLWHLARERLGLHPSQVDASTIGGEAIRKILQSSWMIAEQVNVLRGLQGTGHGRTLPTGVSPELAMLVVREACSVAEFTLNALDRQRGSAAA